MTQALQSRGSSLLESAANPVTMQSPRSTSNGYVVASRPTNLRLRARPHGSHASAILNYTSAALRLPNGLRPSLSMLMTLRRRLYRELYERQADARLFALHGQVRRLLTGAGRNGLHDPQPGLLLTFHNAPVEFGDSNSDRISAEFPLIMPSVNGHPTFAVSLSTGPAIEDNRDIAERRTLEWMTPGSPGLMPFVDWNGVHRRVRWVIRTITRLIYFCNVRGVTDGSVRLLISEINRCNGHPRLATILLHTLRFGSGPPSMAVAEWIEEIVSDRRRVYGTGFQHVIRMLLVPAKMMFYDDRDAFGTVIQLGILAIFMPEALHSLGFESSGLRPGGNLGLLGRPDADCE